MQFTDRRGKIDGFTYDALNRGSFMSKEQTQRSRANDLLQRAEDQWSAGHLRSAFRLFLAAAKAGSAPALKPLADFYDDGIGVKANEDAALYWYKRAYRHGSDTAANNIGCIWRDRHRLRRAISWFQRAVALGLGDANLEIAKIYLRNERKREDAIRYLKETCKSATATEGSKEEARRLLKEARKKK